MNRTDQFLAKEREIYGNFRNTSNHLQTVGLTPDPAVQREVGGLGVAVRHMDVAHNITGFTRRVANCVPCLAYTDANEHSTLSSATRSNFTYSYTTTLTQLGDVDEDVRRILTTRTGKKMLKHASVEYGKPLTNQTTMILPGNPTSAYVDLLLNISDVCEPLGMKPSWGTHITLARYLEDVPATKAADLVALTQQVLPLGPVRPSAIDVCAFELNSSGFFLHTLARINL